MEINYETITDRTYSDVVKLKTFIETGWNNLDDEEKAEFLATMKGAYNYTDINRVARNFNIISALCQTSLYDDKIDTTVGWSTNSDYAYRNINYSDIERRYLSISFKNIATERNPTIKVTFLNGVITVMTETINTFNNITKTFDLNEIPSFTRVRIYVYNGSSTNSLITAKKLIITSSENLQRVSLTLPTNAQLGEYVNVDTMSKIQQAFGYYKNAFPLQEDYYKVDYFKHMDFENANNLEREQRLIFDYLNWLEENGDGKKLIPFVWEYSTKPETEEYYIATNDFASTISFPQASIVTVEEWKDNTRTSTNTYGTMSGSGRQSQAYTFQKGHSYIIKCNRPINENEILVEIQ